MGLYLVTGAAGFIGAALAKQLIKEGHRVVSIDNLSTGFLENVPVGVEFFHANCQDEKVYQHIPQLPYDAIFHLAGQSSGEISFDDPIYDLRTNAESTLHLLKFALKVNCHRFIYASSMSVYGDYLEGPVQEIAPINPKSFYAIGKLASEHYIRLYEQYGIQGTSLRLFNVYGPGQNFSNLRQGMVSIYAAQMLDNNHILVKGDAGRFRDFVYIDDVVRACLLCLTQTASHGKVINIAAGIKTTVSELIQKLTAIFNKKVKVEYSGRTPGDIFGVYADTHLAKKTLNFTPNIELTTGLKKMLSWASSFKDESNGTRIRC